MPYRKPGTQINPQGCKICGNPSVGRGIKQHVENSHGIKYEQYTRCFQPKKVKIIVDALEESGRTKGGKVMMHVLVRKFVVKD